MSLTTSFTSLNTALTQTLRNTVDANGVVTTTPSTVIIATDKTKTIKLSGVELTNLMLAFKTYYDDLKALTILIASKLPTHYVGIGAPTEVGKSFTGLKIGDRYTDTSSGINYLYNIVNKKNVWTAANLSTSSLVGDKTVEQLLDSYQTVVTLHSDLVTDIAAPVFPADGTKLTYSLVMDHDGTTAGTVNWSLPSTQSIDEIDGYALCYTQTKDKTQADLDVAGVLKNSTVVILDKTSKTHTINKLGTDKYNCIFIFAYRIMSPSAYKKLASGKGVVYKKASWAVSPVTRSHTNLEGLSKYSDKLAIDADLLYGDKRITSEDLAGVVTDFNLLNSNTNTDAIAAVTFGTGGKALIFEGNKNGSADVFCSWVFPTAKEGSIDGFIIQVIISNESEAIKKPTIAEITSFTSVPNTVRNFRFVNLLTNLGSKFNFVVIPYRVLSMVVFNTPGNYDSRKAKIAATPVIYADKYTLALAVDATYTPTYTQSSTVPLSPIRGDYWLNTGAGTEPVTGITSFATARYDNAVWKELSDIEAMSFLDTPQAKLNPIVTTGPNDEPPNRSGFYWKNSYTATVSGVVKGDTVSWRSDYGIWVSTKPNKVWTNGKDITKVVPYEGNLFLNEVAGADGKFSFYHAKNGVWKLVAKLALNEIGTKPPTKTTNATVTKFYQKNAGSYYYRLSTSAEWGSPINTYASRVINSATLPSISLEV